jgi:hypothetical protein
MSRSCHSATFSSAAWALPRSTRARPEICSLLIGLRLWGIDEEPFWPGAERLLHLAHLGALQVADLGRERSSPAPASAIALSSSAWRSRATTCVETSSRSRPRALQHARLELGAGRRVGADGAGDRADGDLREGALQAQRVAVGLEGKARELHAERRRLGVDAVRAPHAQRVRVLARARVRAPPRARGRPHDHLAGGAQLQRERGVEHIRGGQPEVDPAPGLAGRGGEHVDERGHVVVGDRSRSLTASTVKRRRADRLELGGAVGRPRAEQPGQLLAGRDLDPPPGLHARLVGPQTAELGAGVAGIMRRAPARICAARIAALRALSRPTQATGTPGGICTIERIASRPPAAVRRPESGTPITGRSVCAATAPGSAAEMPAPAMITRRPRMRAFLA